VYIFDGFRDSSFDELFWLACLMHLIIVEHEVSFLSHFITCPWLVLSKSWLLLLLKIVRGGAFLL